ncbi:hypothetical protein [Herbiconiux liangxiaofengii]|uniref:hypothetical protein n=1 Tax=Herbiconiux liangxiaofengii TaxID=3342795 RepID=UPI0035BAB1E9
MTPPTRNRLPRTAVTAGAAASAFALSSVLLLAGCSGGSATETSVPEATSARETADPAPADAPVETAAAPSPSPSAIGIDCDELLPAAVLPSIHAGLEPSPSFTPTSGTFPAKIVALGGVACEWTATDGTSLVVAVAQPSPADLASAEAEVAAGGTATDAFGQSITAYYENGGGTATGDVELFTEAGYWGAFVSPLFLTADEAETTVSAVLQALPAG